MTTLIITPIDMAAKGSHAERKRVQREYARIQGAMETHDIGVLCDAYDAIEVIVAKHSTTDDGTSVADALEMASENDFQMLMRGLLGMETIPPVTSAP